MEAMGVNAQAFSLDEQAQIWEMVGRKCNLSSEQIERCCSRRPRTKQNKMDPSESTAPFMW